MTCHRWHKHCDRIRGNPSHITLWTSPTAESCAGSETKGSDRRRSSKQLWSLIKSGSIRTIRHQGGRAGRRMFSPPSAWGKRAKCHHCAMTRGKIRTYLVVARSPEPESGTRCRFRHDARTVDLLMKWIMSRSPSGLNYTQRRAAN